MKKIRDKDCWNLAENLGEVILAYLKHFKGMERMGYPTQILTKKEMKDRERTSITDEKKWDRMDNVAVKRWEKILDEMIFAFEYIVDEEKFVSLPEELPDIFLKDENASLDEFNDYLNKTLDSWHDYPSYHEYKKTQAECEKRCDKGLKLFAKYYRNLWD